MKFKKGDKLLCNNGDNYNLTTGKTYAAITDQLPGIFHNSPFIKVIDDAGKEVACHASRFKLIV